MTNPDDANPDDAEVIADIMEDALSADRRLEIAKRLETEPDFREALKQQLLMARLIELQMRMELPKETARRVNWLYSQRRQSQKFELASAVRRRRTRQWLPKSTKTWWLTSAAAIAAAVLMAIILSIPVGPSGVPTITKKVDPSNEPDRDSQWSSGPVILVDDKKNPQRTMRPGDRIAAQSESLSLILAKDGSKLVLALGGQLKIASDRSIELESGMLTCQAKPQDPSAPLVLTAGRMRCLVVGTAFMLTNNPEGASLAVSQGRVRVDSDGLESRTVDSGNYLSVTESKAVYSGKLIPFQIEDFESGALRRWSLIKNGTTQATMDLLQEPGENYFLRLSARLNFGAGDREGWAQAKLDTAGTKFDGRGHAGLVIRYRSTHVGKKFALNIWENSPTSSGNWKFYFTVDSPNWTTIECPFTAFVRDDGFQPTGATNDAAFIPANINALLIGMKGANDESSVIDVGEVRFLPLREH